MKTNRFEKTIRQKLESIEPDFQEKDWASMQRYMQAHTPPGFWQQYGSWIGYAAAASITTVMAFLYTSQLSRNERLTADVRSLKEEVAIIRSTAAPETQPDTVYIVQEHAGSRPEKVQMHRKGLEVAVTRTEAASTAFQPDDKTAAPTMNHVNLPESKLAESTDASEFRQKLPEENGVAVNSSSSASFKTLDESFGQLSYQAPASLTSGNMVSRKMSYQLAGRLTSRQVQKALPAVRNQPQLAKTAISGKKTASPTQAENVIPKLNIKTPYRFGAGFATETNGQSKAIVAEVLVAKKFSVSAGISWLKVKPMEFFTEKIFRDKNRRDFKRSHPGEVPLAMEVFNINVNPTLVQIPLTVAFRNNLKNDWVYYASAGTNVNITSKEKISFECRAPNNQYYNQSFEKKSGNPVISSANVSVGIEKSWHPIVVQAEGYLYTYFKPLSPFSHQTGPGVKVKLMYQIGRKM